MQKQLSYIKSAHYIFSKFYLVTSIQKDVKVTFLIFLDNFGTPLWAFLDRKLTFRISCFAPLLFFCDSFSARTGVHRYFVLVLFHNYFSDLPEIHTKF